jgi:hypothetical protein
VAHILWNQKKFHQTAKGRVSEKNNNIRIDRVLLFCLMIPEKLKNPHVVGKNDNIACFFGLGKPYSQR